MKKIVLTLLTAMLLFSFGASSLPAQDAMGQGDKSEMMAKVEKISAELQLTPAQKKQILPILMDEAPKLKAIKEDTTLRPLQKAMKLRQISEATDAKLQPILSPTQFQKLQEIRAQERQQMIQKMQNK